MEQTAKYFKKAVLFTDLRFAIALPKCYATHRNYEFFSKSLVPTVE
jgi:hypothetical protein